MAVTTVGAAGECTEALAQRGPESPHLIFFKKFQIDTFFQKLFLKYENL